MNILVNKKCKTGAEEIAHQLEALAAPPEDMVDSQQLHCESQPSLTLVPGDPILSISIGTRHTSGANTYMEAKHSHIK